MPHRRLYALTASRQARTAARVPGVSLAAGDASWLRRHVAGEVILPGDAAYGTEREGFNPRYEGYPVAVVAPRDEAALRGLLGFVRRRRLAVAVRGGGHSFAGRSNTAGVVIDMRHFDGVAIAGTTVRVGAGAQQGPLGAELEAAELHLPFGDWPTVAVGGFMQGGGYGYTARCFGMNLDLVTAVRVMLADGRMVRADAAVNPDLFWAVRGGAGGGFGVLLEVTYAAIPAPRVVADSLTWRVRTAAERTAAATVLHGLATEFAGSRAPDTSVDAQVMFGGPKAPGPWLFVDVVQHGTRTQLRRAMDRLRALAPPVADPGEDTRHDGPLPAISRQSRYLRESPGVAGWRSVLEVLAGGRGHQASLYLFGQGGAIGAVPREACSFIHRTAACLVAQDVCWPEGGDGAAALAFQERMMAALAPWWNGRCYQNFANEALADYRTAYWGEAFPMLLAVRRKYDPGGVFDGLQDVSVAPGADLPPALWPPAVADALGREIVVE